MGMFINFINKGFAKLGETGQLAGSIMTGANLRHPPEKERPAKKTAPKKLRRDHPRRLPQRSTGRATK